MQGSKMTGVALFIQHMDFASPSHAFTLEGICRALQRWKKRAAGPLDF